ncbi:MAG TPA: dTDP-4-amino-4,6-dideoxygalactose transaminase [Bacteroidales bacterium]|jgi:dTDP-4-amino-4,6-dideoxygalactose transaminase|nr:dTDP-4-amino-4,6-dideoxygalactose transaminase [Bacteroidales bacterium]HQJ21078.1 dTDP-4-amino-4,6-dideoxygalactose transaminase [Bacteroidales bacterium]
MITFNKPYLTGKETQYISQAVYREMKISGNGLFTRKCQEFFQERYGFRKCLLTSSCTDALEMAALLCDIQPGDEVIMPSYTFASTANAFILRGARIVFADSRSDHPGMNEESIKGLITPRTKVIVPVHYAGVACDMDIIMAIAEKHNLFVVEDAAQAIDSFFTGNDGVRKPLGSIGHFGCFSFHETKNIQCGEGGMLVINDERFFKRAEIIWEKGTNRAEFSRGEVNKYGWIDIGSSFLPSEITAAFLWAQVEALATIQLNRKCIWQNYYQSLSSLLEEGYYKLPKIPEYATNNAHLFYLICKSIEERSNLIEHLKRNGIMAIFHYLSLHNSPYFLNKHDGRPLPNSERFSECLLRLPLYYELGNDLIDYIVTNIKLHYQYSD